jgi:predicted RecA/RadA family phage recombinase
MLDYTPDAAASGGEVVQLRDGRAGVITTDRAASQKGAAKTEGLFRVAKTTGIVILDGGRVYWDHSANKAHFKTANDRDFFLGTAVGDAASADEWLTVNLNVKPEYLLDAMTSPCTTAITGTAAAEGFGRPKRVGGSTKFLLTATNEAQKVDLLSNQAFAVGANAIVEAIINVVSDGSGSAVDASIGVANGTHATDADTIAESLFVHLDANNANINLESDDGTTEVAATDSTIDYTEGTPFEVWFDLRDPSDIQVYIDGVLALGSTVFKLNAATGPLKLLVHVEKTSSTDTYELDIERLSARIAQQ